MEGKKWHCEYQIDFIVPFFVWNPSLLVTVDCRSVLAAFTLSSGSTCPWASCGKKESREAGCAVGMGIGRDGAVVGG